MSERDILCLGVLLVFILTAACDEQSSRDSTTPDTGGFLELDPYGQVFYDLKGQDGLLLCFHGAGGSAAGWEASSSEKRAFLAEWTAAGWSFICPTSQSRDPARWQSENSPANSDVNNVDALLAYFGVTEPQRIVLVGHSNGGGFASRYAVYSQFNRAIAAVQYANAAGVAAIIAADAYRYPSVFQYAVCDPLVSATDVIESQQYLQEKVPPVAHIDYPLDQRYADANIDNCHSFLNTGTQALQLVD